MTSLTKAKLAPEAMRMIEHGRDGWVPVAPVGSLSAQTMRRRAARLAALGFIDIEQRSIARKGPRLFMRSTSLGLAALHYTQRQRERQRPVAWRQFAKAIELVGLAA